MKVSLPWVLGGALVLVVLAMLLKRRPVPPLGLPVGVSGSRTPFDWNYAPGIGPLAVEPVYSSTDGEIQRGGFNKLTAGSSQARDATGPFSPGIALPGAFRGYRERDGIWNYVGAFAARAFSGTLLTALPAYGGVVPLGLYPLYGKPAPWSDPTRGAP